MIEIRIHGRGGQGAVIACKTMALAAYKEGKYAQSFPAFGVERRGAPVAAFTRIDNRPIEIHSEIYQPDHLIVLDASLFLSVAILSGLKPGGTVLINSALPAAHFNISAEFRVVTIDAAVIAVQHGLGTRATPIVNTAILGAFSRFTGILSIESIVQAIEESVPTKSAENMAATMQAYESLQPVIPVTEAWKQQHQTRESLP
jgi:2-oxoacid:acceptor oxidoreductase gamma subunit (pyruvate/2-ketoisovalerate family)